MNKSLSFLLVILLSLGALAAKKKIVNTASVSSDENYIVPVHASVVSIDSEAVLYQPRVVDYEFSSSNWTPNQFSRQSIINSDANFQAGAIPLIGISEISSYKSFFSGAIERVLGLSYSQLTRSGSFDNGTSTVASHESLNVVSFKLGAAYRWPVRSFRSLQPSLELAALPTWISSEKSVFEKNGVSAVGVILEANLKLLYCPEFMQKGELGQTGEGFGLGYILTNGAVGGSDLGGSGLQAILRLGL